MITRRGFMRALGVAGLSAGIASAACSPSSDRPNIIIILADDLGHGDLSCLNKETSLKTQNIDKLASTGVIFSDAHSGSAVCTPTRYGLLTGRYSWRSRLKQGVLWSYSKPLIEDGRETIASFLQASGYRTACIGKWHLGLEWSFKDHENKIVDFEKPVTGGPNAVGFDYSYIIGSSLDIPPYVYIENDRITAKPDRKTQSYGKAFWREGETGADFEHSRVMANLFSKSIDFIDKSRSEPFFLYLPLSAPHTPILPEEKYKGKSGINEYTDFVLQLDEMVGSLEQHLEKLGIRKNTIVIFASDNGCAPMADIEEMRAHDHDPCNGYRGQKADIYEGGHRIPLIISWPEKGKQGITVERTVCLNDIFATCAAVLDRKIEKGGEDSEEFSGLFMKNKRYHPARRGIIHHSDNGSFAIRSGKWKLIMCPGSGGWSSPRPDTEEVEGLPSRQLFNLDKDPGETNNLITQRPDIAAELQELLSAYIVNGRSTPGAPANNSTQTPWENLWWMHTEE